MIRSTIFFPQIDCNYTYCVLFLDSANRVSAKREDTNITIEVGLYGHGVL